MNILELIICIPFGAVLGWVYKLTQSYAFSVVIFTLITKLIIFPFTYKSKKSMAKLQAIQPKLKELEAKYANTNRQKYSEEVQKLYKEEGASPTGGCLPTLITLPIMLGLYYAIQRPLSFIMRLSFEEIQRIGGLLGIFVENTKALRTLEIPIAGQMHLIADKLPAIAPKAFVMNFHWLGMDLSLTPSFSEPSLLIIIPILAAATAVLQMYITNRMQKKLSGGVASSSAQGSNIAMMVVMPLMSLWFTTALPGGIGIYWIASNVILAIQEIILGKIMLKQKARADAIVAAEEAKRQELRRAIEAKRHEEHRAMQIELNKQNAGKNVSKNTKKKGGKK